MQIPEDDSKHKLGKAKTNCAVIVHIHDKVQHISIVLRTVSKQESLRDACNDASVTKLVSMMLTYERRKISCSNWLKWEWGALRCCCSTSV